MDTVITVAALVLAIVGVVLVVDVGRIWRDDPYAVGGPERAQLLTGIAVLVFGAAFLASRGGDDEQSAAAPATTTAAQANSALTKLAAPARLPQLARAKRRETRPERRHPQREHKPQAEEPPAPAEETTTTTATTSTTTPTTTTPAPTTPAPTTPEPAPSGDSGGGGESVPFDSRE